MNRKQDDHEVKSIVKEYIDNTDHSICRQVDIMKKETQKFQDEI